MIDFWGKYFGQNSALRELIFSASRYTKTQRKEKTYEKKEKKKEKNAVFVLGRLWCSWSTKKRSLQCERSAPNLIVSMSIVDIYSFSKGFERR